MKKQLRVLAMSVLGSVAACAVFIVACSEEEIVRTDAGTEAGTDGGGADVITPTEDGGVKDTGTPDVISIPDFVGQIESAMCGSLARCCFGNENIADGGVVDGGKTYNGGKCLAVVKGLGFEFSAVGTEFIDGGTVAVDATKAADCAAKLKALTCNMTGQELATIRTACYDSFVGNRVAGQACIQSVQCPKGHLCDPTKDGGTCQPLRGDGGSCDVYALADGGDIIVNSIKNEEACSTRGGGDTKLHCNTYDPNAAPPYYRPRNEWVCVPQVPINGDCNSTVWCDNGICDTRDTNGDGFDDYQCHSPVDYFATNCNAVLNQ
jgi:hypothetical protein